MPKNPNIQDPSESSVVALYDETAESYARMMDEEITLPVYSETLGTLSKSIDGLPGAIVDTSCGTGHMLWLYRTQYDPERTSIGVDLSPRMVQIARSRLGDKAQVCLGDMRHLTMLESESVAGMISFFSIHHLSATEIRDGLKEWSRVLRAGGRLVLAAWEGSGRIDYGQASDIVAYKHTEEHLTAWLGECGFRVDRRALETIEEMRMDAVYLGAERV